MRSKVTKRHEVLRSFLQDHPDGWHHGDWEGLLDSLRGQQLVEPGEEDAVGMELEREHVVRLLDTLSVQGLGPKRRDSVVDAFPRRHDLETASVEALSRLPSMNRRVAEALVDAMA